MISNCFTQYKILIFFPIYEYLYKDAVLEFFKKCYSFESNILIELSSVNIIIN